MKTEIENAISRSASHNEIVTVRVDEESAKEAITIAKQIAVEAGLYFETGLSNEGAECWACNGDSEEMEWRLDIRSECAQIED